MHQKIEVIGRLGRDPESRFTPSGQQVTSFSVATDNQYVNAAGEKVKETTWFRVTVWGNQAEACNKFLKKGSLVFVEGRLTSDKSTGGPKLFQKKDESWSASFEINAPNVKFLSPKSETETQSSPFDGNEEIPQF